MIDASAVLDEIGTAFHATAKPGEDLLLNRHCDECIEVSEAYRAKTWQDIQLADVIAGRETALLTPEAWRYYLPALLVWCVREPEAVDVLLDNVVYELEPPDVDDKGWFAERAHGFTPAQMRAMIHFLEWYRERQDAEYELLELEPPTHVERALTHWRACVAP